MYTLLIFSFSSVSRLRLNRTSQLILNSLSFEKGVDVLRVNDG